MLFLDLSTLSVLSWANAYNPSGSGGGRRAAALAHNLMLQLEVKANHEEGIQDKKVERKYAKALEKQVQEARRQGRRVPTMIDQLRRRATQFSFQFICSLHNHLAIQAWHRATLPALWPDICEQTWTPLSFCGADHLEERALL